MQIAIPIFFIFTIYAFINSYLPLVLAFVGYNITQIGLLMAIFDFSGTFFTLFVTSIIQKKGHYGISLFILSFPLIFLPLPIITNHSFLISAICLGIYATGFRALVPVSDTVINSMISGHQENYGKIRSVGSVSFVLMELILQYFLKGTVSNTFEIIIWMSAPALFTAISLFFVPGLMAGKIKSKVTKSSKENKKTFSWKNLKNDYPKSFWALIMLLLISYLSLSPINKFFSLYVTDFLHINAAPLFWAIQALVEVPFMIFSGSIIKKFGNKKLLVCCLLAASIRLCTYVIFPNFAGALCGQLLNALTFGLLHPVAINFIAEHVNPEKQVTGLAFYTVGTNGIGNIVGSALGGIVISHFGFATLFLSAACLPPIGIILFLYLTKNDKN